MKQGLDYAYARISGASVKAAGYDFAIRYLSDGGPELPGKLLLPSEAEDLHANGVDIVLNWETTGRTALGGFDAGVADAQGAVARGSILESPVGTVVYFSIDFQATDPQEVPIIDYYRGVNSVIGVQATGAYADYDVLQHLYAAGVITWAWQTQAWSHQSQDPRINILQNNNAGYVTVDGIQCDLNEALTENFGQWSAPARKPMSIPTVNVGFIDDLFNQRVGDDYVYGGVYSPDDVSQGCDCSGLVGWVLEGYTKGQRYMSWAHNVSTESWPYDYGNNMAAEPGTVGPYGTIAIGSPADLPDDAALLICIMHGGGGEDSHINCLTGPAITPTPLAAPAGKIMESNGDYGSCTNGTGGTPADSNIWTDWWYLPGPIEGYYAPPPPPAPTAAYTVRPGDTMSSIAAQHHVSLQALEAANPQISDPDLIDIGQILTIP